MARYDVPRPKRSDYTHRTFSGKWFDRSAYESAVAEWQRGRDEFNERQRLSTGRVTKAIVSGAIAVAGATSNPEQSSDTNKRNFGQSSLQTEGDDEVAGNRSKTAKLIASYEAFFQKTLFSRYYA